MKTVDKRIDEKKSLTQLENDDWGPPDDSMPPSIQEACNLRHKPLKDLELNDLRLLLNYGIGTEQLMPKAMGILKATPLVEAKYFKGDLLAAVLSLGDFYETNPGYVAEVKAILHEAQLLASKMDSDDQENFKENLSYSYEKFELYLMATLTSD